MYSRISNNINYRFAIINLPNILNILIPILLIPIVVQSNGVEEFGRVIFYQGIIGIILIITENGLNTISLSELNKTNLNQIVFHLISIKLFLSILLLSLILLFIPNYDLFLFLFLSFSVIGQSLNVSYIYIFKKSETIYAILLLITKLISLAIFIIYFKKGILSYAIFLGVTEILIGFLSLLFCGNIKKILTVKMDIELMRNLFRRGLNFCKINLLSAGYSITIPIYLKFILGFEVIGIYGAIEKVYRGFCNISAPFNLILLGERKFESLKDFFQMKQAKIFLLLLLFSLLFVGIFADHIMIYLLTNIDYNTYRISFLVSLVIPVIVFFSRIFVINFFVKNALEIFLVPIYLRVFLISIPINIFFIYFFGLTGCIIGSIIVEVLCLYLLQFKKNIIIHE